MRISDWSSDVCSSDLAPVVVTCAGRTRGIIGVLGLRLAGIEAPVYALENGTQGWNLAGFALERGNPAAPYPAPDTAAAAPTPARAEAMMQPHHIAVAEAAHLAAWRGHDHTTTDPLHPRTPERSGRGPAPPTRPS